MIRYKIKFSNGKTTALRFHDWNNAEWFLLRVLKYRLENYKFIKNNIEAVIVCKNGIPF